MKYVKCGNQALFYIVKDNRTRISSHHSTITLHIASSILIKVCSYFLKMRNSLNHFLSRVFLFLPERKKIAAFVFDRGRKNRKWFKPLFAAKVDWQIILVATKKGPPAIEKLSVGDKSCLILFYAKNLERLLSFCSLWDTYFTEIHFYLVLNF